VWSNNVVGYADRLRGRCTGAGKAADHLLASLLGAQKRHYKINLLALNYKRKLREAFALSGY
jgi:hypothetical protein